MQQTFKEWLREQEMPAQDPEDLSAEELMARSQELRKQAAMKKAGREDQVKKLNLRSLQDKARKATDPRQKADYQRRIRELMTADKETENQTPQGV